MNTRKKRLALKLLDVGAIQFGEFKLKLHEANQDAPLSPIFLNLRTPENPKPGPLTPEIMELIGEEFLELLKDKYLRFDFVAGIPNAGDPIADAFEKVLEADWGQGNVRRLRFAKETDGMNRRIGKVTPDRNLIRKRVLLLDDLITRADSKLEAVEQIKFCGGVPEDILVLVDRQQGGREQLEAAGHRLHSVYTLIELLDLYVEQDRIDTAKSEEVLTYIADNST